MKRAIDNQILRFATTVATVCGIVVVYFKWVHVNPTTVGFTFLLAILMISAARGLRYFRLFRMAIVAALVVQLFLSSADSPFHDCRNAELGRSFCISSDRYHCQRTLRTRSPRIPGIQSASPLKVNPSMPSSQQLLVSENVFELLNLNPNASLIPSA